MIKSGCTSLLVLEQMLHKPNAHAHNMYFEIDYP